MASANGTHRLAIPSSLLNRWQDDFGHSPWSASECPDYFYDDPNSLLADCNPISFMTGCGNDIFSGVLPRLEMAESELVFVTCFWAESSSRDRLVETLRATSARVVRDGRPKVKVFIGLSSVSLLQKLFHTNAVSGYEYPALAWQSKLGVPSPSELPGLDVTIKSVFVKPFSVMHPKFIIMDRARVWLPSCNVSWETWFEGCVELTGPITEQFVRFWKEFWLLPSRQLNLARFEFDQEINSPPAHVGEADTVKAVFLPSPHHANPRMRPLPWQYCPAPPPTPLNAFTLTLFACASASIYMQTPNLTAPPVLAALLQALKRGIDVHIVTSERLMMLEQLVTAGTTTSRRMRQLVRRYKRAVATSTLSDEESGLCRPGNLCIEYYQADATSALKDEPVQSHLKLTIVDEQWTILGSGNMDRASWYTSQELGVAFYDANFARQTQETVAGALKKRKRTHFASAV